MNPLHVSKKSIGSRALVLLHGWGFDSQVWDTLLPALTLHFSVYVVDLPGFGESSEMDWPTFKKQLLEVLPETFIVVGWSLGGLYAMRLAIEHPLQVQQLISVGSAPRILAAPDWPVVQAEAFENFSERVLADPAQTLEKFLRLQAPQQQVVFLPKRPLKTSALQAGLSLLKTWDLRDKLHTVKSGCFMFGRLDRIVPARICDVMKQRYPQFQYVVFTGAGHTPFLSHPAEFLEALLKVV